MDNSGVNVYRALHEETGEVHYFVGTYDEERGKYMAPPQSSSAKNVIGTQNEKTEFDTFADAMQYRGYIDYKTESQSARIKYGGVSKIMRGAWGKDLGDGYAPYKPGRRGRRKQ